MAAAPRGADNLDYEEASILTATRDLDFVVEESGELDLLFASSPEKSRTSSRSPAMALTPEPGLLQSIERRASS